MRVPIVAGARKSNGVPATGRNMPVGIRVASTGVMVAAFMVSRSSRIVCADASPARLKKL